MSTGRQREVRHSGHMSETEALMWAAERDPWLSSAMGSVLVLDRPADMTRLRRQMIEASHTFLRLRERVDDGLRLTTPRWVVDDDFDLDNHLTERTLPQPGGWRELLEMTAEIINSPFDRSRPLWHFVSVRGSGDGGDDSVPGALITKMHHSITDGIGAVRLAEMYLDIERDPAHRLDESATIAGADDDAAPTDEAEGDGDGREAGEGQGVVDDVGHIVRRQLGLARRVAGEVALWGADPGRARKAAGDLGSSARAVVSQFGGDGDESRGGSALWRTRSDRRRLEVHDLPLDEVKEAARARGGTVNDLFVTGAVMAAAAYHARRDVAVDRFNLSFILSTRSDHAAGGNSFAPVPITVGAQVRPAAETFAEVQQQLASARQRAERGSSELMELAAGVMSTLPSSLVSRAGRARAAKLDFATSNLRAAPFTLYVAGAEITRMYPIGPLVGTAWNLTALSYDGVLYLGVFIDPTAVDAPAELRDDLAHAYRDLLDV